MYKIFSVDDHVIEHARVWSDRVPAKFREAAPHVIEEGGREFWVYEGERILTMGLNAVAGKPRDQWDMEPTRFTDMIPGCYDPAERAKDMLSQGVLASVNFPTLPRFGGMLFTQFKDKQLADACVQAWNDFILDEWCPGGPPGMFVPMVICQVWDPKLAAEEIRRTAAKGAKALCFTENPVGDGLPTFHSDHWDPLWDAVQDADLPVCMHIGSSGSMPIIDPSAPFEAIIAVASVSGWLAMNNLLCSDVCLKFPRLKLVFSEAGIGWIPALLERADRQLDRHSGWSAKHAMKPSDIFRRNMYACMVEEPVGLSMWELIGKDNIVSETDYPHADTPYPHVQEQYKLVFDGIPDDVVEAVSHGNAERIFNWTMADASLLDSPDVASWRSTLERDPFAAMKLRHAVEGVAHVEQAKATAGGPCPQQVLNGALYESCGATVDAKGRCEQGHQSELVDS